MKNTCIFLNSCSALIVDLFVFANLYIGSYPPVAQMTSQLNSHKSSYDLHSTFLLIISF